MNTTCARTWLSAALLSLISVSCAEEKVLFLTIEEDCHNECHIAALVCENDGDDPEADKQGCIGECLEWKDDAVEQGIECARSYERMMACVGKLETCMDFKLWGRRKDGNPCLKESAAFDRDCEDF